ncbi:SOUL family heme-binding protein [Pseudooctadecabacter jejudonensis]|uniref:SOUL heme-binding protein n=1 Tax=Pseudooctadecabacter jejudonensis TaxID=1391910 RepID=A0A1Y5S3H5_9RHOB|nr:heme-binding protein [Pseudooctadecabacter jejudonensis]SLN30792.1 SOUL heme-binding protein [Pseudooctadecabacter jejudonensis]
MRKLLSVLGIGLASMATAQDTHQDGYYGKYETPSYTVQATLEGAEVRQYAPHLLAVVAVRGDRRGALNRGFRTLAGYIFGGNEQGASVSMTSPVTQKGADQSASSDIDDIWEVTFMMPTEFNRSTLPAPNNPAVRFVDVPERRMLVATFTGRATSSVLEDQTNRLRALAANQNLTLTGAPTFMFYDGPATLPNRRRNEVGFVID